MIVMKFGGTSVGSRESIENVCSIVRSRLDRKPMVVTSAHSGVTNMLETAAAAALAGNPSIEEIEARQLGLIRDLELEESLVRDLLDQLAALLKGVSLVEELTPRTMDQIYSFGERMSSRVLAASMRCNGIQAEAIDSFALGLRTDANYGEAAPDPSSYATIQEATSKVEAEVIITTGFIAKCPDGHITTLGRGGSDFSATIMGAAVGAEEVEIWTDVNGVMTADPNLCPAARSLPELSFKEASELAWFGAKVLHPRSIQPAVERGIPVRVLNTMEPENCGTVIVDSPEKTDPQPKSIVYKRHISLVNIVSSRMLGGHGFIAAVFNIFEKYEVVINMIATAEISISLATDVSKEQLAPAIAELEQIGEVMVEDGKALICVVGEGMAGVRGMASQVFDAFRDANVNVEMISQGTREINIAILIENGDVEAAVQGLHTTFFEG
ncbi:MAG: aspartate kinase [Planctomycetota bacterium]|jgi:aspartate kinase